MKGLTVFVADIRNCTCKEQEQRRVEKELAKIRAKFTNKKALSSYDKKKYTWKLLYSYMLGYDIDFGHIQAVNLCSGASYSEKTVGYFRGLIDCASAFMYSTSERAGRSLHARRVQVPCLLAPAAGESRNFAADRERNKARHRAATK